MRLMAFEWNTGERPPEIEAHSRAKLDVLRKYISYYFDTLNSNFLRDEFNLDLVDGFSGGGVFRGSNGEIISGTPLIMLEEIEAAKVRLNERRSKPLAINCRCYFVDKDPAHADYLRRALNERGYSPERHNFVVINNRFENVVDDLIAQIRQRQPRVGRSLFVLDQCGYAQVHEDTLSRISDRLPAAEIILTFAAGILVNLLAENPNIVKSVGPIGLSDSRIRELIEMKNGEGGLALVERAMREHIRVQSGMQFDTPFFIAPEQSRRVLWFHHLSRHPVARNVMLRVHWDVANTFRHYGPSGLDMLGWDSLKCVENLMLFGFGKVDSENMRRKLAIEMPRKLFSLGPITFGDLLLTCANNTAATSDDLQHVLLELAKANEICIANENGRRRSSSIRIIRPHDCILTLRQRQGKLFVM